MKYIVLKRILSDCHLTHCCIAATPSKLRPTPAAFVWQVAEWENWESQSGKTCKSNKEHVKEHVRVTMSDKADEDYFDDGLRMIIK